MRGHEDIRPLQIARVELRLVAEHIERGPAQVTVFQRLDQRIVIDQRAACAVHQHRPASHLRQRHAVDHANGLGRRRTGEDHDIRGAQQIGQLRVIGDVAGHGAGGQRSRVMIGDPHPQRAQDAGDLAPDPAHADDPRGAPLQFKTDQLGRVPALPRPRAHQINAFLRPPRQPECQEHRRFRHRRAEHIGRIEHPDPAFGQGFQIQMVRTHRIGCDDLNAAWQLTHEIPVETAVNRQEQRFRPGSNIQSRLKILSGSVDLKSLLQRAHHRRQQTATNQQTRSRNRRPVHAFLHP